jgi:hypothetical protein
MLESSHDVKLDNLDMEMSDDENDSLVKGLPIPTINSSTKSPSVRTHLDPRQNRINNNSSYSPSNSAKDEIDQTNATKNPLDFLTRFISKTSSTAIHSVNNNNQITSNNNIISSLQKYVGNTATSTTITSNSSFIKKSSASNYDLTSSCANAYDPREYNYEGYYNEDLYNDDDLVKSNKDKNMQIKRQRSLYETNQNTFINPAIISQNQRSVTPTKDEIYQNTDVQQQYQQQYHQPPSIAPPPPPPPHHALIGHSYTMPPPPQTGYPQSLISPPPNVFNNPLMQPPPPLKLQQNQYIPTPNAQSYPMPALLQNYQKPLNNSNTTNTKPSNNININTNDLNKKNDDSMKRKHERSNSFEYPNVQQNNNFVKNQNSYRIPTISSSYHRSDSNGNTSNNKSNFNTKYNQPQSHRSNSYYNNKHHKY